MRTHLFASLSLLPLMSLAAADSGSDQQDPVVVTATRLPTPESQIASSITVVTAADIAARQLKTLPDLLQQVPGLNVVQTGGAGGQTSVFMRGTNSNHTKVFVDGIDVADPSNAGGTVDLGNFLAGDIARVEILRGPQSGLYGSDAIGGVINIITQRGEGAPQGHVALEGGSFDTFNQSAALRGSSDGFHYAVSLDHLHSGSTPVTPLELLAPGEQRHNDYHDNLTASSTLGYDFGDTAGITWVGRYIDTKLRLTGDDFSTFPATPAAAQSENDTRQMYTRLSGHYALFDGAFDQIVGVAYSNLNFVDFTPDTLRSDLASERLKIDWQGNVRFSDAQKLVLGVEHQRDEIREPLSASLIINSGYAELQSAFGDRFFDTVSVRYDDNDHFGSKFTYRVAPAYLIRDSGTKFKASIGTGFKAPTLDQLFQNFPDFFFFANPNLRPESSLGYDFGVEQALAGDKVTVGLTYYRNDIKGLITTTADFSTYTNIGHAVTEGAESFVSYRPLPSLNLRIDYTYTQADDRDAHQELLRRPKHKADLNAGWTPLERLTLDATLLTTSRWIDGNRDFSIARLSAPGYTVLNLAASVEVNRRLDLTARIDNALDRHYQDPTGFLRPSIGAYAGLKARF